MTAQPPGPQRLQALERAATVSEREDAEDTAALQDWAARQGAGQTSYVPADEVRARLGLAPVSLQVIDETKAIRSGHLIPGRGPRRAECPS